jgi:hypothetical protein
LTNKKSERKTKKSRQIKAEKIKTEKKKKSFKMTKAAASDSILYKPKKTQDRERKRDR